MAIHYSLSLPEPHTHILEVQIRFDAAAGSLELVMPSWTPGSYLLREYARNVQDFAPSDASGGALPFRKIDKNTWRIDAAGAGEVTARYRVYANELSVRTSHLDASHGYVNGASVFMYVSDREDEEVRLTIERPQGWEVATSLRDSGSGDWVAEDYDELVDCPIEIGTQRVIEWEQEGIPHRYAFWGPTGGLDEDQLVADTRRVIDVCSKLFGGLPYDRYLFLVHVGPEGRGGLEHKTSTTLLVTQATLTGEGYESLISLVAHEFFHVWLGKRIRPAPLGPFDYTRENYTRNLWVVEGFTTYFTDRILLLAGLMSPERYLERLGDAIAKHQELPGRHHQSLEDSSFDTWIKFYRPDAHTPNSQVSYYQKGALVAMALDLEIRSKWRGERSLDGVMQELWRRHEESSGSGFAEEGEGGIQEVVEEVYGGSVGELFAAWVRGVDEIDFDGVLARAGLKLVEGTGADVRISQRGHPSASGGPGLPMTMEAGLRAEAAGPGAVQPAGATNYRNGPRIVPPSATETRMGLRLREETGGRVKVTNVLEGSPAHRAGVNVGDEILAIDGARVRLLSIAAKASGGGEGTKLELLLMRREEVLTLDVQLDAPVPRRARVVWAEETSQQDVGAEWLRLS